MSSFIGKFRRKKAQINEPADLKNSQPSCNGSHRDSLNSDHIYIPQMQSQSRSNSLAPPASDVDIGSGSDHEGIQVRKQPQLAYSLDRLLRDSSALSYFIQFLEASDKLNLIKFWMHVEGFKSSFSEEIAAAQDLSFRDAKSIYEKYIDEGSTATLALPKKIKQLVDENMSRLPLQKCCFDNAQEFVKKLFEYRYFEEFQSSVYFKKHELEVLSNGCSLNEILKVQPLLLGFLEFIKEKEDHDMLQFLLGLDSFEASLDGLEDSEALDDAMSLYEKYFSMQATNSIDLGPAMRAEIESLICDESGRPDRKAFRNARTACIIKLHDKYVGEFLKSHVYQGYLTELATLIENTIELPRKNRHRAHTGSISDATSSTDSLSQVFSRHLENLERKLVDNDRTPTNTPSPSKRSTPRTPRSSRLAEIDEMGRYRALYDDSHTHSPSSAKTPHRIKSTLRKYLDKTTLREEEIAEEVARTIIKDMQSMVASSRISVD